MRAATCTLLLCAASVLGEHHLAYLAHTSSVVIRRFASTGPTDSAAPFFRSHRAALLATALGRDLLPPSPAKTTAPVHAPPTPTPTNSSTAYSLNVNVTWPIIHGPPHGQVEAAWNVFTAPSSLYRLFAKQGIWGKNCGPTITTQTCQNGVSTGGYGVDALDTCCL